jgi:YYY domain-containing protein
MAPRDGEAQAWPEVGPAAEPLAGDTGVVTASQRPSLGQRWQSLRSSGGISRWVESRYFVPVCLGAILLLGAYFRFTGVNWDDYTHLHPDERFVWMVEMGLNWPKNLAQYFDTATSPLNPYNSGSSFVYGTFPLFLTKAVGQLLEVSADKIHLLGRVLAGVFDLVTVWLMFFIGRRLYGKFAGLLASLFTATLVIHIQQSHFFTVDSFVATFVAFTFYWAIRVAERGRWSDYLWMGLSYGLAVASKINVALFGLIMALACAVRLFNALREPEEGPAAPDLAPAPLPVEPESGEHIRNTLRRWKITLGGVRIAFSADPPEAEVNEASADLAAERVSEQPLPETGEVEPEVESEEAGLPNWLDEGWKVALRFAVSLVVAFLAFRIAQPYTFQGPGFFDLKLAAAWLKDVKYWGQSSNGLIDLPFSMFWTDRAPVLYSLQNMVLWAVGVPLSLASWAGWLLAWYELICARKWQHLLVLAWTTFIFLYQSTRFGKLSRYLTPFYPFMALLAGYLLVQLWRKVQVLRHNQPHRPSLARWVTIGAVAVILFVTVGSVSWAYAFTRIYTRPLTRVAASLWVYDNIPAGSAIGSEHWDDAIPWGGVGGRNGYADGTYGWVEFHPYAEDEPQKLEWFVEWLNKSDYIILSSNRCYGSIPRLPMRFPMTTRYYEHLFSGELGFDLIREFTSRPNLGSIEFVDDDAEEPFTVYDHPKVSVFKKSAYYSAERVRSLLGDGIDWSNIARIKPIEVPAFNNGLQMTDEETTEQQSGGTWSDIFDRNSLSNKAPVLVWLLLVEVLGLVTFPLSFLVFRSLKDRGYIFSKTLGVLLLAWITWILVSAGLATFSRAAILASLLLIAACSGLIVRRKREELLSFWQEHRYLIVINEVLFLLFFLGFLGIRYGNPDLWHAIMGGEKPMDFAYLNAVLRSTVFPPYDPWYAGGYLNYYYFGQIVLAVLIKLVGIVPWVAYNLCIPLLAALTAMGAFSVVYNLTAGKTRRSGEQVEPAEPVAGWRGHIQALICSWEPGMTWGLFGALLVAVLGNLAEIAVPGRALWELGTTTTQSSMPWVTAILRVLSGLSRVLSGQARLALRPEWPYWNPSRVMPNGEINEFPFFTFLYADLHAHLIALPFTLLALALAVAAIKRVKAARRQASDQGSDAVSGGARYGWTTWLPGGISAQLSRVDWSEVLLILVMGLVVGALRPINSWDYPTYMLVMGVALLLHEYEVRKRLDPGLLWAVGVKSAAVLALSYGLFWPFLSRFTTAYTSIERWKGARTGLGNYLGIHGLFLFVIVTWMCIELFSREVREGTVRMLQLSVRYWDRLPRLLGAYSRLVRKGRQYDTLGWIIVLPLALVAVWLAVGKHWFFLFVWLLILGTLLIVLRLRLDVGQRFVWLLFGMGLALSMGVDLVVLKGDIGRMNTVFKFYLQIWVFWSVATAVGLSQIAERFRRQRRSAQGAWRPGGRLVWQGALTLLVLLAALYPVMATRAKISDRFDASLGPGLDGMAYMETSVYYDNQQMIQLKYDREAINWLLDNVEGSPVIAEANTEPRGLYRWGSRVSIYTGLPTIIGWSWHQRQQRSAMPGQWIDQRLWDVQQLYSDASPEAAMEIIRRYNVRYIYVGEVERIYYSESGLAKFERMRVDGLLELAYRNEQVNIYLVKD